MSDSPRLRVISSLGDVAAGDWNACARDPILKVESEDAAAASNGARRDALNPFVSHEFLSALERSQSVGRRTGWEPRHLVAESAGGKILGAVPCYLKSHSRGEYVFDR